LVINELIKVVILVRSLRGFWKAVVRYSLSHSWEAFIKTWSAASNLLFIRNFHVFSPRMPSRLVYLVNRPLE